MNPHVHPPPPPPGDATDTEYYFNNDYMETQNYLVPFQPPEGLSIIQADLGSRRLTFSWSPVTPDCPAIHYNILASNCGSCPTTTNHTNVTCTDVPTDGSVCTFAVRSIVCGSITGNFSESIEVVLKGISACILILFYQ
jgi:hypothetical protein